MILLNIFVFIVISFHESLATPQASTQSSSKVDKIYIVNSCCVSAVDGVTKVPIGYIYTSKVGLHKIHSQKKTWNDARNICNQEGGKKS